MLSTAADSTEPMLKCCTLMLLHFQILSTMSNSKVATDSCVTVLTKVNYVSWRLAMKAYLQFTGHTWVMEIGKPDPLDTKSTNAQVAHYIGWTKANDSIVGSVNMHLSDVLCWPMCSSRSCLTCASQTCPPLTCL